MNGSLSLAWRLLRGGGRRGLLGTWLTLGAVAVSTALLVFAVSANFAFQSRADREAWRTPVAATGTPIAVQALGDDYVRGRRITVVDLAALGTAGLPKPPGLPRFPAPGRSGCRPAWRNSPLNCPPTSSPGVTRSPQG